MNELDQINAELAHLSQRQKEQVSELREQHKRERQLLLERRRPLLKAARNESWHGFLLMAFSSLLDQLAEMEPTMFAYDSKNNSGFGIYSEAFHADLPGNGPGKFKLHLPLSNMYDQRVPLRLLQERDYPHSMKGAACQLMIDVSRSVSVPQQRDHVMQQLREWQQQIKDGSFTSPCAKTRRSAARKKEPT